MPTEGAAADVPLALGDVDRDEFKRWLQPLQERLQTLPDKPEENAVGTLCALWHLAAGSAWSVAAARERALPALDPGQEQRLESLVSARLAGTPLAHLTGRQRFMGLELLVGPEALLPRRETELLGNAALAVLRRICEQRGQALVIDVCTGCGNLALALAYHEPRAVVHAADLSTTAVDLARRNLEHLDLGGRVHVVQGNLLQPFERPEFYHRVDLLVCNPPYISTVKLETLAPEISAFEPRQALDGGPFGVGILHRLLHLAPRYLRSGGWLAVEVGLGQGPAIRKWLLKSDAYDDLTDVLDDAGQIRALLARARLVPAGTGDA